MHTGNQNLIHTYLSQIGLSDEEIKVYETLLKYGEMTILELSKHAEIERTRLYRLSEKLLKEGIINARIDYNKKFLQACEISKLKLLIEEYIEKANSLKASLPLFLNSINDVSRHAHQTGVKFYRGPDGIKQILWNELEAKGEVFSYSYRYLEEVVGVKFFIKLTREIEKRNIKYYDLRSSEFIKSAKVNKSNPFKGDIIRYIDPKILEIPIGIDIYNDTIAIFNWHEGEIFGVEITNKKLAKMQKQMFKVFWERGK